MTVGPLFFAPSSGQVPQTLAEQVAAYSPAVYWRLGESSGTSAVDSSGNGRNGTYVGAPTFGSASLGDDAGNTAVTFSGSTGQYCSRAYEAWMNDSSYSAFVILKPSNVTGIRHILNSDDTGSARRFQLRLNGTALELVVFETATSGATVLAKTSAAAINAAMCVGVSVRRFSPTDGRAYLYLNGTLVASQTGISNLAGGINANGFRLGAQVSGSGSGFAGVVDEFAYFIADLSAAQHLALAQKAGYA